MRGQVPRQAPYARVTELVYVSDSNPDAERRVSSNLTSRTKYRTGVMEAHLALTQEDEDRNLGAVPYGSMAKLVKATDCKSVIARSNRAGTSICRVMSDGSGTSFESCGWHQRPWGSAPPPGAKYKCSVARVVMGPLGRRLPG